MASKPDAYPGKNTTNRFIRKSERLLKSKRISVLNGTDGDPFPISQVKEGGESLKKHYTMESLILAQDER
jgi:hypothetical protein